MITPRRRNQQIERTLHAEVALQLKALGVLFVAPPNGFFIPARSASERTLAARLVRQLIATGGLTPGAPDFIVMTQGRVGCIELKRPANIDLFGRKTAAGRPSAAQRDFCARAQAVQVPYAICSSWDDVSATLQRWELLA